MGCVAWVDLPLCPEFMAGAAAPFSRAVKFLSRA